MELIAALAEAHKCQEATLEVMKKKLEENQSKTDKVEQERQKLSTELEHCKQVTKDLESDKEKLQMVLDDFRTSSHSEIHALKTTLQNKQSDWERLLNEHKEKISLAEEKVGETELELVEALNKVEQSYKKEAALNREFKKLKASYTLMKEENSKIKLINANLEKNLQKAKMDLLKMSNCKDRLADEVRWAEKQIGGCKELCSAVKQEKQIVEGRYEECLTSLGKNHILEKEVRDLNLNVLNLAKLNKNILESICFIKTVLAKDTKSVFIQTDMSGKDLSEYEHLDKEATLLVIGLREELVSAKDQLIRIKQENEQMKNYMCDSKRQMEMVVEAERIQRLEQTVNSLAELVNRDVQSSAMFPSSSSGTTDCVMASLEQVRKDLGVLKTRNWHRVTRTQVEVPTRDRDPPPTRVNFRTV
uniref:Uncharacterized protein n=1 Tax=Rhodnius prolixus TaxID=13249 RepID=T1I928_RHOPR